MLWSWSLTCSMLAIECVVYRLYSLLQGHITAFWYIKGRLILEMLSNNFTSGKCCLNIYYMISLRSLSVTHSMLSIEVSVYRICSSFITIGPVGAILIMKWIFAIKNPPQCASLSNFQLFIVLSAFLFLCLLFFP